ncbi:MAG: outer membrane protein transport protein [Deltaproteobacteria bacterium]|nr:outer membrane protein transport protein [Candidatus Tharpella aukensis]
MNKNSLSRVSYLSVVFLGVFSIVFYAATSWAVIDYVRRFGFNASADARGGTSIAIGDDVTNVEINPALISETKSSALQTDLLFIFPRMDFLYDGTDGQRYKSTNAERWLMAPTMSFAHKIKDSRWAWGLSFTAPDALLTDYTIQSKFFGPMNAKSKLMHLRFGPALSYQITPKLSIGTRLNIDYGSLDLRTPLGTAFLDTGNADGFGVSGSVGLLYKPMDNLSIGIFYESPAFMQDLETGNSDGSLKMMTPGGEVAFSQLDVKMKDFAFPQNFGLGVAYSPIPSVRLSADIKYINWEADWDKLTLEFGGSGAEKMRMAGVPTSLDLPTDIQDQIAVGVGVEYFLSDNYTFALGYHYHDEAIPDKSYTPITPPELTHSCTCGFSFKPADNVKIAFAYIYSFMDDPKVKTHAFDKSLEGQLGLPSGALQSELCNSEADYHEVHNLQLSVSLYW